MRRQRKRIWGYTDLGRPIVPPLPNFIVMTDRVGGTRYVLTVTGTAPSLTFALSSTLPTTLDVTYYGTYAGPYLNGTRRLFISSGALSSEQIAAGDWPVYNAKVLARRGQETTGMEVTLVGTTLTYSNYDF